VTIDLDVKLAVYRHFAEHTTRPTPIEVADVVQAPVADVLGAYARLRQERVLVLEEDGATIRMAPPFSGVRTQHVAIVHGKSYYANCAWDVLGVPAALQAAGTVHSRCEQSGEPLTLAVDAAGPERSDWLFHCHVPAARWWDDIVFT